jgi:hypothetical protein
MTTSSSGRGIDRHHARLSLFLFTPFYLWRADSTTNDVHARERGQPSRSVAGIIIAQTSAVAAASSDGLRRKLTQHPPHHHTRYVIRIPPSSSTTMPLWRTTPPTKQNTTK